MKKISEKTAFVTGGNRGMGAAIVKQLSADGADVVFTHTGKNTQKANQVLEAVHNYGGRGTALIADNQNPGVLLKALKTATDEFGSIDILVNNAGIYSHKPIEEYTLDEYDRMMNVNVKAVFVASQFAARSMQDGGRIITIGSNLADRTPAPGNSLYSMSKSALTGLTKGIARDLGPRNITANLIQPGPVNTGMNPEDGDAASFLKGFMATNRYGTVDEIAALVAFLSGPESQYITGTSLTIDGGFNI